jgi:hypothetical protein
MNASTDVIDVAVAVVGVVAESTNPNPDCRLPQARQFPAEPVTARSDQAEMLTGLSGLYDKLVSDVAARVIALQDTEVQIAQAVTRYLRSNTELENWVTQIMSDQMDDTVKGAMDKMERDFEERIEDKVDEAFGDLDIESHVKDAIDAFDWENAIDIDTRVQAAVDEIQIGDKVASMLDGMTVQLHCRN